MQNTTWIEQARKFWGSRWLRPLNDVAAADDFLGLVNPLWSLTRIRARLVRVADETADTRTFWFETNRLWRGFTAGQHVVIEVEINGVRHHRTFSISSTPRSPGLALTVKRHGRVTAWMHDRLKVGDVVTLSAPAGRFVLPAALPTKLLFISAGSGITPVMALLRELQARDYTGAISFVHACRTPADLIFATELRQIAQGMTDMQLHLHFSAEAGRLTAERIAQRVPDCGERLTYLCGPAGFMAPVRDLWARRYPGATLLEETFGLSPARSADGAPVQVRAARSDRSFTATGGALLAEAEAAGLAPRHGCRIGICQSCKCVKRAGTVQNLLTGRISSEPGEWIQICVSAARSDLVLEI